MSKKSIITLITTLLTVISITAQGQGYISPPVEISTIKFNKDGVEYFSHPVLEKQTLYAICKAYQVSPQDIYDANRDLNIESMGLKTGQAILIPNKFHQEEKAIHEEKTAKKGETTYVVKWYEDLDAVAKKFNISKESIMAANGLTSQKLSRKQVLIIPFEELQFSDSATDLPHDIQAKEYSSEETAHDTAYELGEGNLTRSYNQGETISISLVLPFGSTGTVGEGSLDFYSGALLALKDLSEEGISTKISAMDVTEGLSLNDLTAIEESDFVLGPISTSDITSLLDTCPAIKLLVSPLDSRVSSVVGERSNIIQAPSSSESQNQDVIRWIRQDLMPGDKVILIREKGSAGTLLDSLMENSGIPYETYSYGILEGRDAVKNLTDRMTKEAANRIVIASDKEAFVNDAVRNLDLMVFSKFDVALYAPSKIKSFETIDVNYFHNTNLHLSSSYFVNYDDNHTKKFLLSYRALFKAEPSQYAYQGYDLTRYFVEQFVLHGGDIQKGLDGGRKSGLQSDFLFGKMEDGGYLNTAVRRIEYSSDNYSVEFISEK